MKTILAAALGLTILSQSALAEQAGDAGMPLAQYCNTVPALQVQRRDSVDNWIRICTVWLNARCKASDLRAPRPTNAPSKR